MGLPAVACDDFDPAVADAARTLLEHLARKGPAACPPSPTMDELWKTYWQTEGRHLKSGDRYKLAWDTMREIPIDGVALESKRADQIDVKASEAIRDARMASITRMGKAPKPGTVNRELSLLRRLLTWAEEQKLIKESRLIGLKLAEENNVRKSKIRSEEEFQKLFLACSPMMRALVLVLFDGGMRRMEAINLRREQVVKRPDGTAVVELSGDQTKNKRPRRPRLTSRAVAALEALPQNSGFYFANPDTELPYHRRWIATMFARAVEKSGLEPWPGERITLHTLRHSYVYVRRAIDRISESTIMILGGWRTRRVFFRYGIVDDQEIDQAITGIEERLKKSA